MKKILAFMLSVTMVFLNFNIVNVFAEEKEPLTITQLEITEPGIEKERKSDDTQLLTIYNDIKTKIPRINNEGNKIILPETGNDKYSVSLYGSSNKAVIDMEGNISQPLEDMRVYLYYQVTNNETKETLSMDDPILIEVNGQYDDSKKIINRPSVMPGIREWKGDSGQFNFNGNIVISDDSLKDAANIFKEYIEGMTSFKVTISSKTAEKGDILLSWDKNLSVGDEGYTLDINDILEVKAVKHVGIVYAGATITQMLMSTNGILNKGLMRDYPQYEVRSTMIDIARFYMPLDYLEEITKYAAFFKLNEFHAHINDDGGEQNTAFRVESKKYPDINKGIPESEVYLQQSYKDYQKNAIKYGIDVVTEIDTPAHSGAIAYVDPSIMLDGTHIDIKNKEAIKFIKSLYDEFLDGEDPVFQSTKFDIGVDEYNYIYTEDVRAYMDEMAKYVLSKGIEPRVWCSLNDTAPTGPYQGYGGTTPVTNALVQRYYNDATADLQILLDGEYKIINNMYQNLYIVPVVVNGCNDYIDLDKCYNNWEVGRVSYGENTIKPGHPLLLGSETSIWNDAKVGCSEFDIFDRCKDQIMVMSEKNWYGENTQNSSYEDFIRRIDTYESKTPLANPGRTVESSTNLIASYIFDEMVGNKIKDRSSNGYDATVSNLQISDEEKALKLDGNGYLSLPFDSVGFPYYLDFTLNVSKDTPKNAKLFEGKDGALFLNYDGTRKIGFERKGYSFIFDYVIPTGVCLNYSIVCKDETAYLYVEDVLVSKADYYKTNVYRSGSTSFILPTEKIGSGVIGYLYSLKIQKELSEDNLLTKVENLALNKKVTVSGLEGGYTEDGIPVYPQFDPKNAVDGNDTTRTSLDYENNAWLQVDLGSLCLIDRVSINLSTAPDGFDMMISEDGENWVTISSRNNLAGGDAGTNYAVSGIYEDELEETIKARYVKFQQTKCWYHNEQVFNYSAAIGELSVYGVRIDLDKVNDKINEAKNLLNSTQETNENKDFLEILKNDIMLLEEANNIGDIAGISKYYVLLIKHIDDLKNNNITVIKTNKTTLKSLLDENLDLSNLTQEQIDEYKLFIKIGQSIYDDIHAKQEKVDYIVNQINKIKNRMNAINLALNKKVTVSGLEGGYNEDGTPVYPQFDPKNAVDDNSETKTSLDYENNAWLQVDLGSLCLIDRVSINLSTVPDGFDMLVSKDGENWVTISSRNNLAGGDAGTNYTVYGIYEDELEESVKARYVKFQQTKCWYHNEQEYYYSAAIGELKVFGVEFEAADYSKVNQAKEKVPADLTIYTEDSVKALKDAINAVEEDKGIGEQAIVDGYAAAIETAISNLKYKAADYSKVNQAKEKVPADLTLYTKDTVEVLKAAIDAVEEGKNITEQAVVDGYAAAIETAVSNLKYKAADYSKVNEAKEKVPADLTIYTKDTVEVLKAAIDAVEEGKNITEQAIVDGYAAAIESAIYKLKYKDGNYSKVNEAKEKVPADLTLYTKDTVEALKAAIDAVEEGKDITEQEVIDGYAADIETAISNLKYKPANYEKVDEALHKVPVDLSKYTKESVTALKKARDAVDRNMNITKQKEVDAMASAIEEAITKLVYKSADYTKVDEILSKVPVDLSKYTKESVNALKKAIDAIDRNKNITEQEIVNGMAMDIEKALNGLIYKGQFVIDVPTLDMTQPIKEIAVGVVDTTTVKAILENSINLDAALKEKVEAAIASGKNISIKLVVQKINVTEIDAKIKKEIENKTMDKNLIVAQYFDLSIVVSTEDGVLGNITKFTEPITYKIAISKELIKEGREFTVVRVHDGAVELLPIVINNDGTGTFKTDRLSPYALAYKDIENKAITGNTNENNSVGVDTGDQAQIQVYISLGMMTLLGSLIVLVMKKREG